MNWLGTTQTMNMAILALASLLYQSPEAAARGGSYSHVDLASTRPIEELPPDVRRVVGRWKSVCGFPLAARRSFVHYLGDRSLGYQFIALHFHDLSCDNTTAVCNDRGGGIIAFTGNSEIPAGAFSYRGPCPPNGQQHVYEWTVQALDGNGRALASTT